MTTEHAPRPARRAVTLADAAREFWRHPSPRLITATLVAAVGARLLAGDWQPTDAIVPVAMVAVFPFVEWVVHVCVLHWRPRRFGRLRLDPLLARKHREHHVDPRVVPLIFIPWQALTWVLPVALGVALLAFPRLGMGLTFLVSLTVLGLAYEWCHYLIHSDYKPKTAAYRAVWRNHRQHHFKNEHYWFTVTSAGTADRVLGTCPDPATVATSPTAKNLHATTGR
ncbi:fatty acid hydroxylase [Mycobacterium sp. IS-1496]|uniref:sterol desaturase family protein n=1 Tax=Mycobacterium sp. IS-1496 TaxID=1772284 RepID=UPI0007415A3D|nr:sterol desaturase family protein [Mycobacterium sp. IS-1496]KUI36972.1 fatty acid hydroxylase [Mycobacterium sp. IS-1496]